MSAGKDGRAQVADVAGNAGRNRRGDVPAGRFVRGVLDWPHSSRGAPTRCDSTSGRRRRLRAVGHAVCSGITLGRAMAAPGAVVVADEPSAMPCAVASPQSAAPQAMLGATVGARYPQRRAGAMSVDAITNLGTVATTVDHEGRAVSRPCCGAPRLTQRGATFSHPERWGAEGWTVRHPEWCTIITRGVHCQSSLLRRNAAYPEDASVSNPERWGAPGLPRGVPQAVA